MRTMLFTVELSDVVTGFVILTETILLLPLIKDGVIVPGRSCLGASVVDFALQNVDCTRNSKEHQNRSRRDAPKTEA